MINRPAVQETDQQASMMSDVTSSSIDEDENFLDPQYGNNTRHHFDLFPNKLDAKPRRKSSAKPNFEADEFINLLHGSDPVRLELSRLENEVRDKDRELAEAQAEIKASRLTVRAKEKAFEELSEELNKVDEKLKATELLLENKSLELKRVNDEKKAAIAAQTAAEATLRRIQAAQKDEDIPPLEEILAPLEAELKLSRQEIAKLQEDNRALDRLTKSKEAALLEAERTIQIAEAKASLVDDLQNRNQELSKQIEICQEENKILDKMHRQKVAEVEKLSTSVSELEEAVLAGGATANAVRDYQRQIHEYMEEKKTLERELAKAKIAANRVASVVANEWKDANDKVMPVKQWLTERRFLQGEMQQLREKLAISERTSKYEAQLKEKYHARLKVIEETLKTPAPARRMGEENIRGAGNGSYSRRQSMGGGADDPSSRKSVVSSYSRRRSTTPQQIRGSVSSSSSFSASSVLKNVQSISKSFDGGDRNSSSGYGNGGQGCQRSRTPRSPDLLQQETAYSSATLDNKVENVEGDTVSGIFYDMLQKEVITLKKAALEKDQSLKDKDDAIEMLSRKVDTLTKAMEVEAKKMRREVAAMEKEVATMRVEKGQDNRARRLSSTSKGVMNGSQLHPGRSSKNV